LFLSSPRDPFRLLGADSGDPALKLQVKPDPSGRFYSVVARYVGGWQPGLVQGKLVFETSDRKRPHIEVPFEAEVKP
jgi:hypothetical protein